MAEEKDISEFWIGAPKMEGDKVEMKDLVDKDIVIIDAEIRPSLYREGKTYALIQIEREGKKEIIMTSAGAVQGSIRWLKDKGAIPGRVKCKIIQERAERTGRLMYKLASTVGVQMEEPGK